MNITHRKNKYHFYYLFDVEMWAPATCVMPNAYMYAYVKVINVIYTEKRIEKTYMNKSKSTRHQFNILLINWLSTTISNVTEPLLVSIFFYRHIAIDFKPYSKTIFLSASVFVVVIYFIYIRCADFVVISIFEPLSLVRFGCCFYHWQINLFCLENRTQYTIKFIPSSTIQIIAET